MELNKICLFYRNQSTLIFEISQSVSPQEVAVRPCFRTLDVKPTTLETVSVTVGLFFAQVSDLQVIDRSIFISGVFIGLLLSCEPSVAGQALADEAFVSHEEEEKWWLKK